MGHAAACEGMYPCAITFAPRVSHVSVHGHLRRIASTADELQLLLREQAGVRERLCLGRIGLEATMGVVRIQTRYRQRWARIAGRRSQIHARKPTVARSDTPRLG